MPGKSLSLRSPENIRPAFRKGKNAALYDQPPKRRTGPVGTPREGTAPASSVGSAVRTFRFIASLQVE